MLKIDKHPQWYPCPFHPDSVDCPMKGKYFHCHDCSWSWGGHFKRTGELEFTPVYVVDIIEALKGTELTFPEIASACMTSLETVLTVAYGRKEDSDGSEN